MNRPKKGQQLYQDSLKRWRCDCPGKPTLRITRRDQDGKAVEVMCWAGTRFDVPLKARRIS